MTKIYNNIEPPSFADYQQEVQDSWAGIFWVLVLANEQPKGIPLITWIKLILHHHPPKREVVKDLFAILICPKRTKMPPTEIEIYFKKLIDNTIENIISILIEAQLQYLI